MADHLNGAQLEQIRSGAERAVQLAIDRMQLRKLALEQALPHGSSPAQIIDIAQALFDFMIQPANIKIDIGGQS
jgi:hypothetical protein